MVMDNEIKVEVGCDITVSDATAEKCLMLLEWWQNANSDKQIRGDMYDDGTVKFRIAKKGEELDADPMDKVE